jgi:hypothetical protein
MQDIHNINPAFAEAALNAGFSVMEAEDFEVLRQSVSNVMNGGTDSTDWNRVASFVGGIAEPETSELKVKYFTFQKDWDDGVIKDYAARIKALQEEKKTVTASKAAWAEKLKVVKAEIKAAKDEAKATAKAEKEAAKAAKLAAKKPAVSAGPAPSRRSEAGVTPESLEAELAALEGDLAG